MADLDDEFARFEAELQSLEQNPPTADAGKYSEHTSAEKEAPADSTSAEEPPAKKVKSGLGGLTAPPKPTVVVASKPKIYMAPPRPAPVKKPHVSSFPSSSANSAPSTTVSTTSTTSTTPSSISTTTSAAPRRPGLPNTLADVAAHRGALSGFPMGTTGSRAASGSGGFGMSAAPSTNRAFQLPMQPRVDMDTGRVLPVAEQELMNVQQSVYEYDPSRATVSSGGSSVPTVVSGPHPSSGATTGTNAQVATTDDAGESKPKRHIRLGGGAVWEDPTLADWPENDFRLFCGDLGNEVSDELLAHSFAKYASFQRARVVRDKLTHKSRGYGFVSFADPFDCAKALREMNGKYIGNRPVKLSKSKWEDRNLEVAKKKMRKRKRDKHHLFN